MKILECTGPRELKVSEAESVKDLPAGYIRIKTLYSAISHGTEMNVYRGCAPFFTKKRDMTTGLFLDAEAPSFTYPFRSCDKGVWYLGYQCTGVVTEVGEGVENYSVGDLVFGKLPHQSEQVVPADSDDRLQKLPKGTNPKTAALFNNLVTIHGGVLDVNIRLGETVVVFGLGVLGQLYTQLALLSGASRVYGVDVIEKRRQVAKENGCCEVFDPTTTDVALEIRKRTNMKGPDLVVEASGNTAALNEAIRTAAIDSTVKILGWYNYNLNDVYLGGEFHHNRLGIKQSHPSRVNPEIANMWDLKRRFETCADLLCRLKLDNLVTHVIPYDDAPSAYELIDNHPEEVIQVVFSYE